MIDSPMLEIAEQLPKIPLDN